MIMRIPILKSILRNLDWFEEAQKHHKAPEGTIFVGGINHRLKKEDWAEQKHPRADDGKFTSGSGGGSKKPSKTKRKLERRAEAASQGRVSGAIQTLLSGGSALDKIGWLQKPKPELKPETHNSEEELSILDIINRRNEQAAALRGKVPGMEHPSQRSVREGGPEGGHSPRVLTQHERDYRDSQRQWDNDRRRMGIPVPGDELATLEISGEPKSEKKPEPEKPKPAKPPAANIESAKNTIRENLKSGKLKKETVIAAVRSLYEQANEAESKGDDATAKKLDQQAEIMTDAAGIKGELYSQGILQIRGSQSHIGSGILAGRPGFTKNPPRAKIPPEGIWTGHGPRPATDPKRDAEIRRLGPTPKQINSLETSHRIEAYRNKVISRGERLEHFKEGDQDLGLYEYNGKTYLVDHERPNQFSTMSADEWRRLKDELVGDGEPPHAEPIRPKPVSAPAKSPHVTTASSSDIVTHGKKVDEHGNKSLHEYGGGLYVVTQGKPNGLKISRTGWESMKYD